LEREGSVTYPCDAIDEPGREILFGDGFPTPTGRGKLVPTDLLPPDELPDETYPMILTTGRLLEHWHTGAMTRRSDVLSNLEPTAIASLNPGQLQALDLKAGERITVTTRRGAVSLVARADTDVPEGVVFMPFCFTEAAANLLTNPQLDPFGKIPEFKFCAARVEKVTATTTV
jgi:formate dehydrogenase major subunit